MRKMKVVLASLLTAVLISGCSASKQIESEPKAYASYLDGIDVSDVQNMKSHADYVIDITDVSALRDFATNVFIGTIDHIDGCSSITPTGQFSPMPQTYGSISVLKNLKGDIASENIQFARDGGILSIADYEKNAPTEMVENDDNHRNANGNADVNKEKTLLSFSFDKDITIEAGKTYLFFTNIYEGTDVYNILGVEYGTRELVQESTNLSSFRSLPKTSSLKIKNNETEKLEDLEQLIDQYF